ncbi:60S ribosomal protein uL30 [Magnusiomyces paraingens]|uniref:Ribosomal protein L30 ferredoxin-like fold domain-containing protein n=1 Tax=Magnusiomyces paraingens TaxID=2606893 RepID=A0A5E8B6Q5_9ASCO|nr:uncharacterized protein SAPINGB_P001591 [Saprochaete ingens]VVT47197.1 unnamed protein product [Saprochaete ingens]
MTTIITPESLQKLYKREQKQSLQKAAQLAADEKALEAKNKVIYERAAAYEKEYEEAKREIIEKKRAARADGSFYLAAQPKLVYVVRIKGINKIPPKPRKVLQLLRLLQINNGTFVRVTKATEELLRLVEPYVAYGYPNLATVRKLVYKRGYGKLNNQRIKLDNSTIEAALGQYGIISIEDLVHEIYTVGPNFKQANNFLWPFHLSNPSGGWGVPRKFIHYIEGGATGNREENINALVEAMN